MLEYIKKETAIRAMRGKPENRIIAGDGTLVGKLVPMREAAQRIRKLPADDVTPVVRCKNCRYWTGEQISSGYQQRKCERLHILTFSEFYCSYAYARIKPEEYGTE